METCFWQKAIFPHEHCQFCQHMHSFGKLTRASMNMLLARRRTVDVLAKSMTVTLTSLSSGWPSLPDTLMTPQEQYGDIFDFSCVGAFMLKSLASIGFHCVELFSRKLQNTYMDVIISSFFFIRLFFGHILDDIHICIWILCAVTWLVGKKRLQCKTCSLL